MFAAHLRRQGQHLHARQPQLLGRLLDLLLPEPLGHAGHEIGQTLLRFRDAADELRDDGDRRFPASLHGVRQTLEERLEEDGEHFLQDAAGQATFDGLPLDEFDGPLSRRLALLVQAVEVSSESFEDLSGRLLVSRRHGKNNNNNNNANRCPQRIQRHTHKLKGRSSRLTHTRSDPSPPNVIRLPGDREGSNTTHVRPLPVLEMTPPVVKSARAGSFDPLGFVEVCSQDGKRQNEKVSSSLVTLIPGIK